MKLSPTFTFITAIAVSLLALTNSTGAVEMKKAPIDTIFPQGEPNPYGKFFTGQTYLSRLSAKDDIFNAPLANVTFEPGARTNWHKPAEARYFLFYPEKDAIRKKAEN